MNEILSGIVTGAVGGAIAGIVAGLTVMFVKYKHDQLEEENHKSRIYQWLKTHTGEGTGYKFRSTRAIASYNNLSEDRVRYICSIDDRVLLSTASQAEELWGLHEHVKREEIV